MDKLNILSINAHPHDFTHIAATLGIHVERGDNVTVVSVTAGLNTHNEKLKAVLEKLNNEAFINKAPENVIENFKIQEKQIKSSIEKIDQIMNTIN